LSGARRVCLDSSLSLEPFRASGRVAAVDVAYDRPFDRCFAALIVWDVRTRTVISRATHDEPARFPYVPGLLSFREIPPLLPLLEALPAGTFDLLLCDGQGIAHPRRFGLACHLGVIFDCPSVGWAKSRLIGVHREPSSARRAAVQLKDGDEQIGWALRSRENCNLTYVSPGHRVSLADSLRVARSLMGRHRLCEPAREAHHQTALAMRAYRERVKAEI
jgi:deoxyribonuclease V